MDGRNNLGSINCRSLREDGRNGRGGICFFEGGSTTPSAAGRWSDAHPCRGREARSGVVLSLRVTIVTRVSLSLSFFRELFACAGSGHRVVRERTIATNFYIDRVECRLELALQGDELITTGNRDSYFFVILLNEGGMLSLFEEFWRCSRFTLCCTSDVTQHVTESSRITTRNLFFPWKNWNGKIIGAQTLRRVYSRKEQREREKRRRKVSRGLESRRRRMSGSYFNPWLSFEVPPPGSSSPWSHDEWSGLGFF